MGLAKVFDILHVTNEVLTERGVELPLPGQSATTPGIGAELDLMHIQRFLSANCFGDHYTRGGVDVRTRELLTFACSSRSVGASRRSRATSSQPQRGNGRAVLLDVLTQLLPFIGYPRTLNGLRVVWRGDDSREFCRRCWGYSNCSVRVRLVVSLRSSMIFPSTMRRMVMPVTVIGLPVGAMPANSPWWVPRAIHR